MNERDFAQRVASKLDEGLDDLPPGTLYRLRLAREAALSRLHAEQSGLSRGVRSARLLNRRVLIPVFVLVLGLSGLFLWEQQAPQNADVAELDAQVLSEELPVTAYLDQGFETWLYHQSTQ